MSSTITRGLHKVPNLILSDWVKANYNLPEVPIGDISWNRWYNDDWDITIYFEELNSPISAATIDSSVDLLESVVRIHVFVRDTQVHSDSSPLGNMIDMPFTDIDFEINVPSRMALIVAYLNDLIDANTVSLKSEGVMLMDVQEAFEIPNTNWDENVYHWIIPVNMVYTEWSGGARHFFRTFTEDVTVSDHPHLPKHLSRVFSNNVGIPSSSMIAKVYPGRRFEETITVSDTPGTQVSIFDLPIPNHIIVVNSLPALITAVQNAQTNDWIELADGTYNNPSRVTLTTGATKVVVRAQNVLGAVITGAPIDILSQGIIFYGFDLQYSQLGDYIFINGDNVRFARNRLRLADVGTDSDWITVLAQNALIDHNDFGFKNTLGTMTLVGTGDFISGNAKIMWNYYHDRPFNNTPAEAIRFGSSEAAWLEFNGEIAWNRFERISGEAELCTFKCSQLDIHHNTAIDCNSSFTFRHGNFKRFYDNILINSGLRIYGHGHEIRRNQILDDGRNQLRQALVIGAADQLNDEGAPNTPGIPNAHYGQVRDCIFDRNIIVSKAATNLIIMPLGYATIVAPFLPENNIIGNNIISAESGTLALTQLGANWSLNTVDANILHAIGSAVIGDIPVIGNIVGDPLLTRNVDQSYSFTLGSPMKWEQSIRVLDVTDVGPLSV